MKVKVFSESMYLIKKGCSVTTAIPILENWLIKDYPNKHDFSDRFVERGGIGDILPLPQDIIHLETLRYDTKYGHSTFRPSPN